MKCPARLNAQLDDWFILILFLKNALADQSDFEPGTPGFKVQRLICSVTQTLISSWWKINYWNTGASEITEIWLANSLEFGPNTNPPPHTHIHTYTPPTHPTPHTHTHPTHTPTHTHPTHTPTLTHPPNTHTHTPLPTQMPNKLLHQPR